jgi:hypothetical protein
MDFKHFMFMNDVGTARYSSSIHHLCCSLQTDLRSSERAVARGVSLPGTIKKPTEWIETNNQNVVLFIFELSRMAFPGTSLLG